MTLDTLNPFEHWPLSVLEAGTPLPPNGSPPKSPQRLPLEGPEKSQCANLIDTQGVVFILWTVAVQVLSIC